MSPRLTSSLAVFLIWSSGCFLFPQQPPASPCATNNGGCSANATCSANAQNQAVCACNGGYIGDGKTCNPEQTGPCATAGCDTHATCSDTTGTAICTCNSGYVGNGTTCTPEGGNNPCSPDPCDPHATCRAAADGGPLCTCENGYSGDGFSCVSVTGDMDAGQCNSFSNYPAQCRSCVETTSACSSDISAYQSACASYSACVCGCGSNSSCVTNCGNNATSSCNSAISAVESCAQQNCASACGLPPPDAGTSTLDAGVTPLPDGGTWCGALATCCPSIDSIEGNNQCDTLAASGNESQCASILQQAQQFSLCQ